MRFTNEIPERLANDRVAHLPGVHRTIASRVAATAARAESNLASHYETGKHSISSEMHDVDGYVTLEGPASLSVELGHHARDGSWVEGTRILRDALRGG